MLLEDYGCGERGFETMGAVVFDDATERSLGGSLRRRFCVVGERVEKPLDL